jgi:hypothetical protein
LKRGERQASQYGNIMSELVNSIRSRRSTLRPTLTRRRIGEMVARKGLEGMGDRT